MGFLDKIRRWLSGAQAKAPANLSQAGFTIANNTLASNETIFSAVSMLSGAIASLPVTLRSDYRQIGAESHPVARLLEYGPSEGLSTFEFIRCMETLRDSTGAAYAVKELDRRGQVAALWLMKSENVTPMVERDSRELYYRVRGGSGGDMAYLHNSLVVSVGHISLDGISPINPIDVLRSSLGYDREVKEFSINQMAHGPRARIVIGWKDAKLNADQIKEYDESLKAFKKSGILYMDAGKEVKELSNTSIIDPKVFEVEKITIARVARVYNIPLDKFLPEKSNYSKAEQSDLNYVRDTILPMVRMYEQEFTRKLLAENERAANMRIKFHLNGFARADMETRGKFYVQGIRSGWFCQDDVRELEDLPPIPGGLGRIFYISKDLVPIGTDAQLPLEGEDSGRNDDSERGDGADG